MKKIIILLMLSLSGLMFAQGRQIVEATSGEDLGSKVSTNMQYLFPEFTDGQVFFLKSAQSNGKLNYNMLVGEMQFLNNEEVLALETKNVAVVSINNRIFYPYKGGEFSEELLSTEKHKLRVIRKGSVVSHAKKGAYGTSSSTSSITSFSSVGGSGHIYNLSVSEDVLISVKNLYYLVGENGKYTQITNAKTFTKQFPALRTQIEAYVKEQRIRFDSEDDLKRLFAYCSELNNRRL